MVAKKAKTHQEPELTVALDPAMAIVVKWKVGSGKEYLQLRGVAVSSSFRLHVGGDANSLSSLLFPRPVVRALLG